MYVCIRMRICMYVCVRVYVCMYVCVHVYVCMYIHMYTYVRICVFVKVCYDTFGEVVQFRKSNVLSVLSND